MAYYGDPASALAAQLRQLEEENVRLRNELMDAADEKFNLQATMATIEAEAQHKASQQVVGLQSELNFKVRGGVRGPVIAALSTSANVVRVSCGGGGGGGCWRGGFDAYRK